MVLDAFLAIFENFLKKDVVLVEIWLPRMSVLLKNGFGTILFKNLLKMSGMFNAMSGMHLEPIESKKFGKKMLVQIFGLYLAIDLSRLGLEITYTKHC